MDSTFSHKNAVSFPFLTFSLISLLVINGIFFSGYVILKDPLAYILYSKGIPLKTAYSITTTANILLAICSLFFGFLMNDCGRHKHSLCLGIALSVSSIGLLNLNISQLTMFAISLYVLGGGLYFFNIVIFLNKLFNNPHDRIKGNYLYQIVTNLGAAIGFFIFLTHVNHDSMFKYSFICGTISLLVFGILYKHIKEESPYEPNYFKFYTRLLVLFVFISVALNFAQYTRAIVLAVFSTCMIYSVYRGYKENNKHLIRFISLIFLFSLPYWIANTIFFNEFFYFLKKDVSPVLGIEFASYLILTDPIINVIFGISIFSWQGNKKINSYRNLSNSMLLMLLSFFVISFGLFLDVNEVKINFVYPFVTLILFACSEFLLLSTLNATIRDLLSHHAKSEYFATGLTRASRSFATVVGYYLIITTAKSEMVANEITANFNLFIVMLMVCLSSYIGFYFFKKFVYLT